MTNFKFRKAKIGFNPRDSLSMWLEGGEGLVGLKDKQFISPEFVGHMLRLDKSVHSYLQELIMYAC